jgi:hypothetical protein
MALAAALAGTVHQGSRATRPESAHLPAQAQLDHGEAGTPGRTTTPTKQAIHIYQ